jgi:hypothetical protein
MESKHIRRSPVVIGTYRTVSHGDVLLPGYAVLAVKTPDKPPGPQRPPVEPPGPDKPPVKPPDDAPPIRASAVSIAMGPGGRTLRDDPPACRDRTTTSRRSTVIDSHHPIHPPRGPPDWIDADEQVLLDEDLDQDRYQIDKSSGQKICTAKGRPYGWRTGTCAMNSLNG